MSGTADFWDQVELGKTIDFEGRKEFYAEVPLIVKIHAILREQPRNLETIGWGVFQIYGDQLSAWELIMNLTELERRGRAVQHKNAITGMPTGIWWKLAGEDKGL